MTEVQRQEFADFLKDKVSVDENGNVIDANYGSEHSKETAQVPRTELARLQTMLDSAQQGINTKLAGPGK